MDAIVQLSDHVQLLGPPARVLHFDPSILEFSAFQAQKTIRV